MSPRQDKMYNTLESAFDRTALLQELIMREELDRSTRYQIRKGITELGAMMKDVVGFKSDTTPDVIDGMKEVLDAAQAKLDGKPVVFKADMEDEVVTEEVPATIAIGTTTKKKTSKKKAA